jgi:hypothetical protein
MSASDPMTLEQVRDWHMKKVAFHVTDTHPRHQREHQRMADAINAHLVKIECDEPIHNCNVCGTPVMYGERHHSCGDAVMREVRTSLESFTQPLGDPVTVKWELIDELGETVSVHFDKLGHNFGKRGIDFDECFKIVCTPLYADRSRED